MRSKKGQCINCLEWNLKDECREYGEVSFMCMPCTYERGEAEVESCQHGMAMWLCASPGGSKESPHYPTHM